MKRLSMGVLLVLAIGLVGCGGDSSSAAEDVTALEETAAGEDAAEPGDTRTPVGVEHPHWSGVFWDTFWPAEGETAVYEATTVSSELTDVTARVERNVEWQGENWTRIVAGTLEPGQDGVAIYLDDSNPWEVRAKGIVSYDSGYADGPAIEEYFDDPIVIPLAPEVDTPTHIATTLHSNMYGEPLDIGVVYDIAIKSYDGEVTVPYGTLTGCIILEATITGELGGGEPGFTVEVVAHPEQRIVRWTDSPGFILLELKEAWK